MNILTYAHSGHVNSDMDQSKETLHLLLHGQRLCHLHISLQKVLRCSTSARIQKPRILIGIRYVHT